MTALITLAVWIPSSVVLALALGMVVGWPIRARDAWG